MCACATNIAKFYLTVKLAWGKKIEKFSDLFEILGTANCIFVLSKRKKRRKSENRLSRNLISSWNSHCITFIFLYKAF